MPIKTKQIMLSLVVLLIGGVLDEAMHYIHAALKEPNVPSFAEVRALLNDCDGFVLVDGNTRRAVEITWINSHWDSSPTTQARFLWHWTGGEKVSDKGLHMSDMMLNFHPDSKKWMVGMFDTPDGKTRSNCSVPAKQQ